MVKPNPLSTGPAAVTAKHAPSPAPAETAPATSASLPAPPAQPADAKVGRAATSRSGGRAGRVMVGGFFGPTAHKQLKMLAVEQDKTSQELLEEALDLLFSRYGKPQIAQLTD